MSTPFESNPADAAEQDAPVGPAADQDDGPPVRSDVPDDVPVADAVEQAAVVAPRETRADRPVPLEADPADTAEQGVVVHADEDDAR